MKALLAVGLVLLGGCSPALEIDAVEWVSIAPGAVEYQVVDASGVQTEVIQRGFSIMRRQVSQAEYAACVEARACLPLDGALGQAVASNLPVVGVSWLDAWSYAQWLSERTGERYRLPGYGEWVLAAAEAFVDERPQVFDDARDPAQRWLAEYAREAAREPLDPTLRVFGGHGRNGNGLLDMAGNVWEWTDTCSGNGAFCGIRIAAGRHPSELSDFVRDPISGACSVGIPPSHLGFRLVRE
ncbi:SUMF1/EgtB/PvdO family nonheme iron enzyme [Pseudomonas sp. ABC1]|uniref:SUMF1/EgtB/PvdO family nonheme iron enzyme n=1 Tax=Pseudomonas sp. ABC1 TaxID=2748080 RepID=UPI0015C3C427|nr:SUMF1/EgtB/PvdO family nonheme iron enzyme [Pseudomonas sp. ABC1]QLF92642.1 SUMF1/EgtB/PvdO family nonheme iron enzyme [Pseudomonas sp. ABC1]